MTRKTLFLAAVLGLASSFAGATPPQYSVSLGNPGTGGYYTNVNGYEWALGLGQLPSGLFSFLQTDSSGNLFVNCTTCTGGGGGSNAAAGLTGASVPTSASYTAFNSGGNLVGVSASNKFPTTDVLLDALISSAGVTATTALPVQGVTGGIAVPVSGTFWQATQPVSLATNTPTLQASTANIGVVGQAQGSATSGAYGNLVQGAVTSGQPTYTAGNIDPLSINLSGLLRVSAVNLEEVQGSTTSGQIGPLMQAAVTASNPAYTTAQTSPISQTTSGMLRVVMQNANATVTQSFSTATGSSNGAVGVAGIYNTTPFAMTNGQSAGLTTDVTSALYANVEGQRASYRCTAVIVPAATPTDVFGIIGSATKTVKIHAIYLTTLATTAGEMTVQLAKRSTADGAGNSTPTAVAMDSADGAATAVCKNFTANPTTGTLAGYVDTRLAMFPTAALATENLLSFDYNTRAAQAIVLRGAVSELDINLAGGTLPTGASLAATVEWTEE